MITKAHYHPPLNPKPILFSDIRKLRYIRILIFRIIMPSTISSYGMIYFFFCLIINKSQHVKIKMVFFLNYIIIIFI